jgi:FkbM family methyltransferase
MAGVYFTLFQRVYRNEGVTIQVPFHLTDFWFRGHFTLGRYETEESRHLGAHLSPDARVLELGACLGYVSCLTNNLLQDRRRHVVLEPNPALIEWLKINRRENGCEFSVEEAVISSLRWNEFYVYPEIWGGSTKRKTSQRILVKGVTVDELREKYDIDFDTLIVDIEGGELELFRSHGSSLRTFKRIFLEIHPFAGILSHEEARECEDLLASMGFDNVLRDGNFQIWHNAASCDRPN